MTSLPSSTHAVSVTSPVAKHLTDLVPSKEALAGPANANSLIGVVSRVSFCHELPGAPLDTPKMAHYLPGAPVGHFQSVGIPQLPPNLASASPVNVGVHQAILFGVCFVVAQFLRTSPTSSNRKGK